MKYYVEGGGGVSKVLIYVKVYIFCLYGNLWEFN